MTVPKVRKRVLSALPVLVAIFVLVIGVGIAVSYRHRTMHTVPQDQPTTVSQVQIYAGVGARVEPADVSTKPPITLTQVPGLLNKSDLVRTLIGDAVPTNLLLVEYTNQFGTRQADRSDPASVNEQLAWLAEYKDVAVHGGSKPMNSTAPAVDWNCTYYAAVSATTGTVLDAFDYCH